MVCRVGHFGKNWVFIIFQLLVTLNVGQEFVRCGEKGMYAKNYRTN